MQYCNVVEKSAAVSKGIALQKGNRLKNLKPKTRSRGGPSKMEQENMIRKLPEKQRRPKTKSLGQFWNEVEDDKGRSQIYFHDSLLYERTLPKIGVFKDKKGTIYLEESPNRVRVDIPITDVPALVIDYIKSLGLKNEVDVLDYVVSNAHRLGRSGLPFFPVREFKFLRDNEFYMFFPCTSQILRISRKNGKLEWLDYEGIDALVDIEAIIPFDGILVSDDEAWQSVFAAFIDFTMNQEEPRIRALQCNIGFLMDQWKLGSKSRAVVFIDEGQAEGAPPNGRSGKSLMTQALLHVRKPSIIIDAQGIDPNSRFMFQSVPINAQVVILDDVNIRIKSDRLFSIITGPFVIERKNREPIILNYELALKLLLTSNNTVIGSGRSNADRFSVISFSDFFDHTYSPREEWGDEVYSGWKIDEWSRFYTYIFTVLIPEYLKYGLESTESPENLRQNQVIQSTSYDFFNWCLENLTPDMGKEETSTVRHNCIVHVGEATGKKLEGDISLFTRWARIFVEQYLEAKLTIKKSNSRNYLVIGK